MKERGHLTFFLCALEPLWGGQKQHLALGTCPSKLNLFITAKMCTFCFVYIWRIVVLDKLSSLPSKILCSLLFLSNFKYRLRGWKCQYVINSTLASSWHQSLTWRAVIKWSSLKLQQVWSRYSISFTVFSSEILRWNWWTLIDCLLITPTDWIDEITCPCKIVCSHSCLSCHLCNLCEKSLLKNELKLMQVAGSVAAAQVNSSNTHFSGAVETNALSFSPQSY